MKHYIAASAAAAILLDARRNGAAAFVFPNRSAAASFSRTRLAMSDYRTYVRDRVDVDDEARGRTISRVGSSPLARQPRGVAPVEGGSPISRAKGDYGVSLAEIWDDSSPVVVQGGALRTWSFSDPAMEAVQVLLKSEGRPIDADVELWHGPDNAPQKMRVYLEDGALRTFGTVIGTPRGHGTNTVSIRNIGQLELPFDAVVRPDATDVLAVGIASVVTRSEIIQGGSMRTFPFDPLVDSVAIILKTDGRPLSARIELLQGPNNNKQVVELYTEDGLDRPFFAIVETPGAGNVVRVANAAPLEFPLYASVDAYAFGDYDPWSDDRYTIGQWPRL